MAIHSSEPPFFLFKRVHSDFLLLLADSAELVTFFPIVQARQIINDNLLLPTLFLPCPWLLSPSSLRWTFTLVILYFVIGTIMSVYGCWMLRKSKHGAIEYDKANGFIKREFRENNQPNSSINSDNVSKLQDHDAEEVHEKKAGFWGYTMQIIYQIMTCMHSINLLFLLLDTSFNRLPFPWFRMAYFVLWSCTYVAFHWILHACGVVAWAIL